MFYQYGPMGAKLVIWGDNALDPLAIYNRKDGPILYLTNVVYKIANICQIFAQFKNAAYFCVS